MVAGRMCETPGCERAYLARGMCSKCYNTDYRRRHPDKVRAKNAKWRAANTEAARAANREWRERNKDYDRNRTREWWRTSTRRAIRSGSAPFTAEQLSQRVEYYGGKCWICKEAPYEHLDHVKPLNKGGPHILANLRPACAKCNLSKSDKWPFKPQEVIPWL